MFFMAYLCIWQCSRLLPYWELNSTYNVDVSFERIGEKTYKRVCYWVLGTDTGCLLSMRFHNFFSLWFVILNLGMLLMSAHLVFKSFHFLRKNSGIDGIKMTETDKVKMNRIERRRHIEFALTYSTSGRKKSGGHGTMMASHFVPICGMDL